MPSQSEWTRECVAVRPSHVEEIKQGIDAYIGVNEVSTNSRGLSMLVTLLNPGQQTNVHYHEEFESSIYVVSGDLHMFYGDELEDDVILTAGDFIYIPPFSPHKTYNRSHTSRVVGVTARNDPFEQERVIVTPHLDDGRCDARVSYLD